MEKEKFKYWLQNVKGKNQAQTRDNLSRIQRIETVFSDYLGGKYDLDFEYKNNKCEVILDYLSMSKRQEMPNDINLPANVEGLSTLKSSVKKYIEFKKWETQYSSV